MLLTLEPLPAAEEYAAWREGVIARRAASPRSRGVSEALAARQARELIDRHLPPAGLREGTEVLAVDADGRRAGTFYLMPMGDAIHLGDLQLTRPADASAVRELVVERLRGCQCGILGVGVSVGDSAGEAFVEEDGFELVATEMQLDLATALSSREPGKVTVRPMTAEEMTAHLANAVEKFAEETMAADPSLTRQAALLNSQEVHERILPQGMDSPGHDFLVAISAADGRRVGIIWLFHEELAAFVYDVEVDEAERGKGFGRGLMEAAAVHLRGLGMEVVGLNVFGHNHVARALYDALGYDVVHQSFNLTLSPR